VIRDIKLSTLGYHINIFKYSINVIVDSVINEMVVASIENVDNEWSIKLAGTDNTVVTDTLLSWTLA